MIKHAITFTFTLCLLFAHPAFAYDFGPGTIDIPEGFESLKVKNVGDKGTIHEFVKPHVDNLHATTIKITIYNFGQKLKRVPEGMLLAANENHLLDYLAGMRRNFSKYTFKKMKSITIDNMPAAHVEWSGALIEDKMNGTVYSLIKGSNVIILDARDYEGLPYDNLIAAIQAMGAVKIKH